MRRKKHKVISENAFESWMKTPSHLFGPAYPVQDRLESGYYIPVWVEYEGKFFLKKENPFPTDNLYEDMPSQGMQEVLEEIKKFWSKALEYKKVNFVSKRSLLLYGPPGCAKSSSLAIISEKAIKEHDCICFTVCSSNELKHVYHSISIVRIIEPKRKILILAEDLDKIASSDDPEIYTSLLSLLDGIKNISNICYLFTSNAPENLPSTLSDRPGRIDVRIKLGYPSADARKFYLLKKFLEAEKVPEPVIETWVSQTEGFSISHIKECFIQCVIMGKAFKEVICGLRGMSKTPHSSEDRKDTIGFGNGH